MGTVVTELPALTSDYAVSEAQVAAFQRDGHLLLPGVCSSEEVAAYRPVIAEATAQFKAKLPPLEERDTFGKAFVLVAGLWNGNPAMARFTLARRFAKIAAELMGVPAVRLYHDVAINKEPGGGYTPWHQDAYYWPMDTDHTITMWMPLVDVSIEMGALTFASGSHRAGFLGDHHISDTTHEHYEQVIRERGFPVVNQAMRAGYATFHAGWTLHSAPPNRSAVEREVITVVYFADGAFTYPSMDNPHREGDFRAYMPGVRPGELAASPINPIVYP